jgi:hypothetical protein
MSSADIQFNLAKCRIIKYNTSKKLDQEIMLANEKCTFTTLQVWGVNEQ